MDAECMKCGEIWDVAEFEGTKKTRFYAGKGCPDCHWGKHCNSCGGTGAYVHCKSCSNSGYMFVRRLVKQSNGPWHQGYEPNVRYLRDEEIEIIEVYPRGECRDGWYEEYMIRCVDCGPTHEDNPCPWCDGTGKLQPLEGKEWESAAWSVLESTDEDPIEIINKWDLG